MVSFLPALEKEPRILVVKPQYILPTLLLLISLLACSLTRNAPEPTSIPPTFTQMPTEMVAISPSPSLTITPAPSTPIASIMPSLTNTLMPTATPLPPITLAYDHYENILIDPQIANGLTQPWVSFRNVNDRQGTIDVRTPQSATGMQTIYLARPESGQRVRVIDIPSTAENDIFWSPSGKTMAYFLREGPGVTAQDEGLYVLDLEVGVSLRFYAIDSLQPRGIPGHRPIWSPNGDRFVMVLPSGYATDIFAVNVDGSNFENLTNSSAFQFWPAWSPDGKTLAFVSDQSRCPTREPGAPNTCYSPDTPSPTTGNLYLLNMETGEVNKVNETVVNGPPQWLDNRYIAVTSGSLDPLASTTQLWLYDTIAGSAWPVTPQDNVLYTGATWNFDSSLVAYQRAAESSTLILADQLGNPINSLEDYTFPRYGVSMAWSANGEYLAIGGRNGQCPYGLIVVNKEFRLVTAPATNLLACDPVYAPTGRYMVFTGIRTVPGTDARQDIFVANLNGLGATNITSSLQGQVNLLGWVGPTIDEAP